MMDLAFEFLKRHDSFVITTHEHPDPDGIGAEMVFSQILGTMGKKVHIVNSCPIPEQFLFMDPENTIKTWDEAGESLSKGSALLILDASDEFNLGKSKAYIPKAAEVFLIDHHEHNEFYTFDGYIDNTASSTCELVVELAVKAGIQLTQRNCIAAFAGLAYDTGFFAYSKTTARTFKTAMILVESGINPYDIYRRFYENASIAALYLHKTVLSSMEIVDNDRVVVQTLRKEDLENSGANIGDSEGFINTPLKCKNVEVSILLKENWEGAIRCSMRSKGKVNVAKIAQYLGGGGHITASGFKSQMNIEETKSLILDRVHKELE
jgi:phosphoesterase RecJ-like protein